MNDPQYNWGYLIPPPTQTPKQIEHLQKGNHFGPASPHHIEDIEESSCIGLACSKITSGFYEHLFNSAHQNII
ncbi:MAG: hypothetical protein B6D64_00260 [Bacteroidetes bacterium 4484_276]|nr:MAG: hypothetical protein B6D64_00260 [Bacteroidetes bacterium 4484_276]OYT13542.1 MAG: hypothetical protein B6I19_04590 [Bacteroidetes bacterium 4572_114]